MSLLQFNFILQSTYIFFILPTWSRRMALRNQSSKNCRHFYANNILVKGVSIECD